MSKYRERLIDHIKQHPTFIMPENRRNEVLGFLAQPLGDLCISRPKKRLSWGIELPFDSDYVTYVWFDALLNYITAIGYPDDLQTFNKFWPADVQLVGKDILTTHAVYWSTMLMALELPLPATIFAHGWWVTSSGKMSKSLGNVINPLDLVDKYGLDPFRFYLFREMVFGADAQFSEESFITRYNADLANDYGNLCNRMLPMMIKNRGGVFHKVSPKLPPTNEIENLAGHVLTDYHDAMNSLMFHRALERVWDLIRRLNKYIDETAPWNLAKSQKIDELDEVFYTVGEGVRFASHLLHPFMPHAAPKFLEQLGLATNCTPLNALNWGQLPEGTRCATPTPIFPRIETARIESLKKSESRNAKDVKAETSDSENLITYDEFMKAELAVAKVLTAEKVQNADKLLKLTIDLGTETRQIVAGIAAYYTAEEMVGKQVIVVKNLEPAKIRGIVSQGMLLAAKTPDDGLALIQPEKPAQTGCRVK